MATMTERLAFVLTLDGKQAIRSLNDVERSADKSFGSAESSGGRFSAGMVKWGAAALSFAGVAGAALFSLANTASDLAEAVAASAVIFGDASGTVEAFGETAAEAAGLSKRAAVDGANTFGVFGKSAGLAGEELAGFSTQMVALAGDLASFKNTTPEQAIIAIGAALRGESEPIRNYGVLLDDMTLRARAAKLEIYDGTGTLTAQQKVLAAQAEILAQTGDAQGDFSRTSDSLANKQRILSADFENLKAQLGEGLIPVFSRLVGILSTTATVMGDFFGAFGNWITAREDDLDDLLRKLRLMGPTVADADSRDFWEHTATAARDMTLATGEAAASVEATAEALDRMTATGRPAVTSVEATADALATAETTAQRASHWYEMFSSGIEGAFAATADMKDEAKAAAKAQEEMDAALDAATEAADEQREAAEKLADQLQSMTDAGRSVADAQIDAEAASVDWFNTIVGLDEAVKEAAGDQGKLNEITVNGRDKAIKLADSLQAQRDAQDEANGVTRSASERQSAWNNDMLTSASTAKGPMRDAILAFIGTANQIPEEKATAIKAALEAGDFATAKRLLDEAAAARQAEIRAEPTNVAGAKGTLDQIAALRTAQIKAQVFYAGQLGTGGVVEAHGWGGSTSDRDVLVGEHGPEIARLPPGTRVQPAGQSSAELNSRGGGGGGLVVNITGQFGNAQDVAEAFRAEAWRMGMRGGR